jgi:hypothetical protein
VVPDDTEAPLAASNDVNADTTDDVPDVGALMLLLPPPLLWWW